MKKYIVAVLFFVGCGVIGTPSVYAESVRIAPLQYETQLKPGERKKGSVDVTNPSNEAVDLRFYVNGFSQVDNKGNLTFFDDEQITKGLLLDYDAITLSPHQTLRLFFIADGTKLPSGDVFAVIFAETAPRARPGTNTSVRVGTLVMLTNGTAGPRHTEISDVSVPFVQFGNTLDGSMTIKNTAPKGKATGFFPDVSVEIAPWGGRTEFKGPLIFAGNSRAVDFAVPSNQFGLYTIKLTANNSTQTATIFLMTGWWRVIVPIVTLLVMVAGVLVVKFRLWRKILF